MFRRKPRPEVPAPDSSPDMAQTFLADQTFLAGPAATAPGVPLPESTAPESTASEWIGPASANPVPAGVPDTDPTPDPSGPTAPPVPGAFAPRERLRPWVWWTGGGVLAALALLAASWLALPVRAVEVTGNRHLTEAQVRQLAGLGGNMGWLYYGRTQARGLLASPWVQSARVVRRFPDTVLIDVTERTPFLRVTQASGTTDAVSADGQVLPGAAGVGVLPNVTGWGPNRLADAILVARALSRYTVQSVAFTPSGVTVRTAAGTVWSGDPKSLVKYAGSISMYPNQTINIYPWGVSVQ